MKKPTWNATKMMKRYSNADWLSKEYGAKPGTTSRWIATGWMPVIYAVRKLRKEKAK